MSERCVRVFLVDDHEIVRRGVADLVEAEPDLEVVGEAGSAAQALARIPALVPDVVVLDVRLPDGDGVTVCRELRARTDVACLMLTSFDDDQALVDAIMAGAAGYLLKQVRGTDIVAAIRTVAAGGSTLDPRTTAAVLARMRAQDRHDDDPLAVLTEREQRVLTLLGQGLTNRQIGAELYLAEKTVKNYVSHVLAKLGVESRVQAAVLATRLAREP